MRLLVRMPSALFGSTTLSFPTACLTACWSRLFASKHTNFPFCAYCFRTQYKNRANGKKESEWMVEKKTQANEIKENAIYWLIFNHRYWLIELFIFRHLFLARPQLSTACQFNRSIERRDVRIFCSCCCCLFKGFPRCSLLLLSFAIFGICQRNSYQSLNCVNIPLTFCGRLLFSPFNRARTVCDCCIPTIDWHF